MKLYLPCMKCDKAEPRPTVISCPVTINEEGLYMMQCSFGHLTNAMVEGRKYEFLFEAGAHALLDGYHREAVTSFAASLERFYEFYVRVIAKKHGIPSDAYKKLWKGVAAQSERQLGLFMALNALESKSAPTVLPDEMIKLRNNAVHKGVIPKREEAEAFAQAVMDIIKPLQVQLRDEPAMIAVEMEIKQARLDKWGDFNDLVFVPWSILRVTRGGENEPSFVERLVEVQAHRLFVDARYR